MTISRLLSWNSYSLSSFLLLENGTERTTIHLLPSSNSNLGGFFAKTAGFLPTAGGDFFSESGTIDELRNSGFLWVCWEGSTFFKPEVTDPPRLSSARRAPGPPPPAAFGVDCDAAAGGGGAAGAEEDDEGTEEGAGSPWTISLDTFSAEWHAADLGVPSDSGGVPLLDVFLQGVK